MCRSVRWKRAKGWAVTCHLRVALGASAADLGVLAMHASGAAIEGVLVFDMNPCKRTGTVWPIRRIRWAKACAWR